MIREDVPAGTSLARVEATDQDAGPNAALWYRVEQGGGPEGNSPGTGPLGGWLVEVDGGTGVVRARGGFDYEETRRHVVRVIAEDCGEPSRYSPVIIILQVSF